MADEPSLEEIAKLLREIVELKNRDIALREEFMKMAADRAEKTVDTSDERLDRIRKESEQREKEQREYREQSMKHLANHTELLSQILTKLSGTSGGNT